MVMFCLIMDQETNSCMIAVNSDIFARVLYSQKKIRYTTLQLTDVGKSCTSRECLISQIYLLTFSPKIKFSLNF